MNARELILVLLRNFFKHKKYSDIELNNALNQTKLTNANKALVTRIFYGVIQNKRLLDFYIDYYSDIKLSKMHPTVLNSIRMCVYQLVFLDRIPESAAVNESVNLVPKEGKAFTNALCRKLAANKNALPAPKSLAVKYSYEDYIISTLLKQYDNLEDILSAGNELPNITIRLNSLCGLDYTQILKRLPFGTVQITENTFEVLTGGNIASSEEFKNGLFTIQDRASMLACETLCPQNNSLVLDTCSAPGGKSFYFSEIMANTGKIISCDIYEHKLNIINHEAKRLNVKNIETKLQNAEKFNPEFENMFDFVLCDVPCSGIGIARKKPDVKYKTYEQIKDLSKIQASILQNCEKYLKPGGALVYSTCSINKHENENITNFSSLTKLSERTLLPNIDKTDGFYIYKGEKRCTTIF